MEDSLMFQMRDKRKRHVLVTSAIVTQKHIWNTIETCAWKTHSFFKCETNAGHWVVGIACLTTPGHHQKQKRHEQMDVAITSQMSHSMITITFWMAATIRK